MEITIANSSWFAGTGQNLFVKEVQKNIHTDWQQPIMLHSLPSAQATVTIIGVSLSEPHHMRSKVKSVFLLDC